jgi:hypothetical protein
MTRTTSSLLTIAFGLCAAGAFAQDRPLTVNDKEYCSASKGEPTCIAAGRGSHRSS